MSTTFYRRSALVTLGVMIVAAPFLIWGASKTVEKNANSPIDWMPLSFPERRDYEIFRRQFESGDVVIVSWPGCTLDDERLARFVDVLRTSPKRLDAAGQPYFERVISGAETVADLMQPPLDLSREQAAARLAGTLVGADGRSTCAILVFSRAGLDHRAIVVRWLRDALAADCGVPADEQHLAGPIIDGLSVDLASAQTLQQFAPPAALLILLLAWWCLGSLAVAVLVFGVSGYCALLSLALIYYSGGVMNAMLVVLPLLVLVLGVSGGVHLVNYYHDAVAHGGRSGAAARAAATGWWPCLLSAGTSAIGLAALAISELTPVEMFGIHGAIGVMATFAVLFLVVPGVFDLCPWMATKHPTSLDVPAADAASIYVRVPRAILRTVTRRPALVTAIAFASMAVAATGLPGLRASVRIQTFFDEDSRILSDYAWLEERVGRLVPIEVMILVPSGSNLSMIERVQLATKVQERLSELPEVGGTMSAATFVPPIDMAGGVRQAMRRTIMNRRLESERSRLAALGYLSESKDEELWRVTARVSALGDLDYGRFLEDVRRHVEPLVAPLAEERVSATYTGIMPLVHEVQRELLSDLFASFMSAFAEITLVMMILERGVLRGLVAMVSNIFPMVIMFGILGSMKLSLDIGTVMTASVGLGMAIDGTLHFLTFFRRSLDEGASRREAVERAFWHCAGAMTQSTVVCTLGLMVFALSSFLPSARFAWMMLAILTAALIGDLVVLPALLLTPAGKCFERPAGRARTRDWPCSRHAPC